MLRQLLRAAECPVKGAPVEYSRGRYVFVLRHCLILVSVESTPADVSHANYELFLAPAKDAAVETVHAS